MRLCHRLLGVYNNIEKHLLELTDISHSPGQVRGELRCKLYVAGFHLIGAHF
ncbi:hypothetical protein ES703_122954 [subsurface metagenome]